MLKSLMCRLSGAALSFALVLTPDGAALADHFGRVLERHEQCVQTCNATRDAALAELPCNLDAARAALDRCEDARRARFNQCNRQCGDERQASRQQCRETRRAERRECRENAREERQECREDRRTTVEECNEVREAELEACDDLATGRERRECRQTARQTARDCRREARETRRECRGEMRDDRRDCRQQFRENFDQCMENADETFSECRSDCIDERDETTCERERSELNICIEISAPILNQHEQCVSQCNVARDARLDGYNAQCSNGHEGESGAVITFINESGQARHMYRPEPYPQAGSTQQTGLQTYHRTLQPGETYQQTIPCGFALFFQFKDRRVTGSDFVGTEHSIGPFPCCEEPVEQVIIIGN